MKLSRISIYSEYAMQAVAPALLRLRGRPNSHAYTAETNVDGLTVRCYQTWPQDPAVLAGWQHLASRVPEAIPFQFPQWQRPVLRCAEGLGRLRLLTVHRGTLDDPAALLAVLPLELRRHGVLKAAGELMSDYLDPLIDPAHAEDCWRALLAGSRRLCGAGQGVQSLVLDNISHEAACRTLLPACCAGAGFVGSDAVDDDTVSRIPLPGSWDDYLKALPGRDRKELRRKIKKAETQGGARLLVHTDPATILDRLDDVFALMELAGGGKGHKARWLFRHHFHEAAPAMAAAGRLVTYELRVDDKHAAGLIGLPTPAGEILWSGAMDPDMKPWSPGIVTFAYVVQRTIARGGTVVDLLRGRYPYKYDLGAVDHPLHTLTLQSTRPAA